jgi:hypothetical protein
LRALTVDTIIRDPEETMADINAALTASKEAIEQLIVSGEDEQSDESSEWACDRRRRASATRSSA